MVDADGGEDVNDFLRRIRELGDKRDKEDEERTRKLEEEILQGRKERQARRAERARSISPTKDSPLSPGTPDSTRTITNTPNLLSHSPTPLQPPLSTPFSTSEKSLSLSKTLVMPGSVGDGKVIPDPSDRESSPMGSRVGTLSWQQRPMSKGSVGGKFRPLSILATENNASRSPKATPDPPSAEEVEISRSQIAQSLGSKDPTWFKQTVDRGYGSAAYRKGEDSNRSDEILSNGSMRLPSITGEDQRGTSPNSETSVEVIPSGNSLRAINILGMRYSSTTSLTTTGSNGSPFYLTGSQRLEPNLAMPSYQGRISPERGDRPTSPTKGLGGFVQSAMLKRSDSVNKRWSAQASAGLSRGNSIASNRSGYDGARKFGGSTSPPSQTQISTSSREHSPAPVSTSRPGSSYGSVKISTSSQVGSGSVVDPQSDTVFAKPSLLETSSNRQQDVRETTRSASPNPRPLSPSLSPSKTMDMRRWSPIKASWLESAINKPDSPKPRVAAPQQPNWLAGPIKTKQQLESANLGKKPAFKEVSTTGLLRSPPAGTVSTLPSMNSLSKTMPTGGTPKSESESWSNLSKTKSLPTLSKSDESPQSSVIVKDISVSAPSDGQPDQIQAALNPTSRISEEKGCGQETQPELLLSTKSKIKPITPPKKDFRSVLKSRQACESLEKTDTPEFKNLFGKLKRTQTQNYVAPDELKDNILRGKAGLMTTGGPKKTERRDEFKESILKKKNEMKAGGLGTSVRSHGSNAIENKEDSRNPQHTATSAALLKSKSADAATFATASPKPETLAHPPESAKQTERAIPPNRGAQASPVELKVSSGDKNLANRFNPALAGLLSRGPLPQTTSSVVRSPAGSSIVTSKSSSGEQMKDITQLSSSVPLNHATKGRARGPKRRLPTSAIQRKNSSDESTALLDKAVPQAAVETPSLKADEPELSEASTVKPIISTPLSTITNSNSKILEPQSLRKPSTSNKPISEASQPSSQVSSTKLSSPEKSRIVTTKLRAQTSPNNTRSKNVSGNNTQSLPVSHRDLDVFKPSTQPSGKSSDLSSDSAKEQSVSLFQAHGADRDGPQIPATKPNKLATSPDTRPSGRLAETIPRRADLNNYAGNKAVGLGILSIPHGSELSHQVQTGLPSPVATPKSPPMPPKKPASIINRIVSSGSPASGIHQISDSPVPRTSEAVRLLAEFFDDAPISDMKVDVDAQSAFKSRQSLEDSSKIKTLRKQIWEVIGDGKKIDVPSQQEHILYHDKMYICTHVFGSITGTRTTEVYLWCGNGVSSSAIEDAQLFARRAAKEHGGKLIILYQGKETSFFFQALGGIVITRYTSSSTYMLCGRRHLGQIAFDEVSFTSSNLCSGFPYIISARFGKLYLWKGKGSGADELGCARLIGMDLGLTGEIEEVDEGHEPQDFWDAFPNSANKTSTRTGKFWHLKPSYEKYTTRLFSFDIESRRKSSTGFMWGRRGSPATSSEDLTAASIKEIVPYAQSDLSKDGIFVLDAFFEIYILTGSRATSKFPTFNTALLFAQEYGILAASIEDRPFIPVSSVILAGCPDSVKMTFRKWEDGDADMACMRKCKDGEGEGGVIAIPLSAALEAIRRRGS